MTWFTSVRSFFVVVFFTGSFALLVSCGAFTTEAPYFSRTIPGGELPTESSGQRTVRVGGDHRYPPFEFLDEQGQPDGFNIEILNRIAAIMDLDLRIELSVWGEARRRLEHREVDMLAGMYRTTTREIHHDFSIPFFFASYGLFVPADSAIRNRGDLRDASIIVHEGDLAHDYVLTESLGREIVTVEEWPDVLAALAAGQGDSAIFGMGQGMREIRRGGYRSIRMLETPLFRRSYGMAVPSGDTELLAILNEGLSVLKYTGEFDQIYQTWFGVLETTPWWKTRPARIAFVLSGMGLLVALAGSGWVVVLRRQVRHRTADLSAALTESTTIRRELEEANVIKLRFLANVSHELRTPLHGIMGMTELLEGTDLDVDQRRLLENIDGAAGQLHRVLSDLLDISAASTEHLAIEIAPFRIHEMVQWLEPTLRTVAEDRNLAFAFSYTGADACVRSDRGRISQIVINLVANAVKFTHSGSVTVHLTYHDQQFGILVHDTGPGIAGGRIAEIFDPFVRINPGDNGETGGFHAEGMGLGLSIVKTLVERLDGEITVDSTIGVGTTFRVSLPMPEAPELPEKLPLPHTSARTDLTPDLRDVRILLVEDEAINRLYLSRLLKRTGASVEDARDGLQAVAAVEQRQFDLILMDISMPNLDGVEATRRIRRWETGQGWFPQPIIALTAHANAEHRRLFFEAGMTGHVSKPYREHQLLVEMTRVLEERRTTPPAATTRGHEEH